MPWNDTLEVLDQIAGVLTGAVAVWAGVAYSLGRYQRRVRLENYLREASLPEGSGREGAQTVLHLVAELGMSEAQVMEAAFSSRLVERLRHGDPQTGLTTHVMLAYKRDPPTRF